MLATYKGYIKKYIFERGNFRIAAIKLDNNKELIIQGVFEKLDPLFEYEFVGILEEHPKYGTQLMIETSKKISSEKTSTEKIITSSDLVNVSGYIKRYLFEDKETSFKIAVITMENGEDFIIKGDFPPFDESTIYDFFGNEEEHQKYGKQLKVLSFKKSEAQSKDSIIAYLKSDNFKGIGEATANKIYDHLGMDCLNKIIENYKILLEISNFKESLAKSLQEQLVEKKELEEIYIKLYSYGLTGKMINILIKKYNNEVLEKINDNPYRLCYEIDNFSFIKCDELAKKLNIFPDDIRRINEGIIYTLINECYTSGHTFITKEQLYPKAVELLNNHKNIEYNVSIAELKEILDKNEIKDRLVIEDNRVYEKSLYDAERNLSQKLLKINKAPLVTSYDNIMLNKALANAENSFNIKYDTLQKDAIFNALTNKVSIITGGPGTGKTTIIRAIIQMYTYLNNIEDENIENSFDDVDNTDTSILLVAPTGRAAKRLHETTSRNAFTIHKALKYNRDGYFEKSDEDKIDTNLIIIDESSMIDTKLANSLFRAIHNSCQVIIVGDINQLPSIGSGNVLSDLISSDVFKTVELKEIQRQAKDSDIILLSSMIKNNSLDDMIFDKKEQVYFYEIEENAVITMLRKFIKNFLDKGGNLQQDLQILAPMYKGTSGIDAINEMIQTEFNTSNIIYEMKNSKRVFKVNDKVLQLANEPDLGIMNGDIGIIKAIEKSIDFEETRILIDFDGKIKVYPLDKLDDLTLGYAVSVHKSQGSEYKNVIMPVTPSYYMMLRRNIYYTGITRTKEKLILIGKKDSLKQAIRNQETPRQTSLLRKLKQGLDDLNCTNIIKSEENIQDNNIIYINDSSIPFEYLGEELKGLTPYDFMEKN